MKNKILIISVLSIFTMYSCVKNSVNSEIQTDPESSIIIPLDFDWKTTKSQSITINETSNILNSNGDTIASNLTAGVYNITIPSAEKISVKSAESKTKSNDSGNNKIYFPSQKQDATAIFEDTFPYNGDMDLNDVFMSFNLEYHLMKDNNGKYTKIKTITIKHKPISCGSGLKNIAIGLHLNIDPAIYSVKVTGKTPSETSTSLFKTNKDGYETDINGSIVVPLINDYKGEFKPDLNGGMANVYAQSNTHKATQNNTLIHFDPYIDFDLLNFQNGNLQLFAVFDKRDHEVFPKGSKATSKFNFNYFKNLGSTDFSRKSDNMVWGFIVPLDYENGFFPPLESTHIFEAYPQFENWVKTGGNESNDWYTTPNPEKVFNKKL